MISPSRFRPAILLLLITLIVPSIGSGQATATLLTGENLRAEPRGVVLGRLEPGTGFPVVSQQDQWVQVRVEGWIWTRSVQITDRLGFDLAVSVDPRENLRSEPSGTVLGQLVEGALLEERQDAAPVPGWTPVRRVAWIWSESVAVSEAAPNMEGGAEDSTPGGGGAGGGGEERERWWTASRPASLLTGPDGDTLGITRPGTEAQVLSREGNWIRVRLEGWVWAPRSQGEPQPGASSISEVEPGDLGADPESFEGRMVAWDLQFVSLLHAERIRSDFYEGEPFLLTRTSAGGGDFVYVAVPPERLGEVEGLIPLERIRVVGRIRTGAAELTGNPILELMELSRISRN